MTPAEALIAAHDRRAELARIEEERAKNVAKFAAVNPYAECNLKQFKVIK